MARSEEQLRPAAAFGHPLFVCALIVLALNDHVLKGSGLLPGVVTGKLSDVAGLLVAPAVLAWIIRARTPRAWLASHVVVGVVFAALELSPALAAACGAWSSALGVPMRMWVDPYDLLALPALAVSYRVLGSRSVTRRSRPAHLIGAFALLACAATSQSAPAVRYPFRPGGTIETDAYVRHMGSAELTMRVRRLKDEVEVDCAAEDEPALLEQGNFMDEQVWLLARGDAVPLWDRFHEAPDRECYAVRLESGGVTWLLAWTHGAPPMREIPIRTEEAQRAEEGAIVLGAGEERPRVPAGITVRRL